MPADFGRDYPARPYNTDDTNQAFFESNSMAVNGDFAQTGVGSHGAEPRIILGLDYGTTNTALAWAQADGQIELTPPDVTVFRNWPEKDAKIVPSAISYSRSSAARRCRQWGWSIDDNSKVLRWTKLEFESRSRLKELEVLQELVKGLDLLNALQSDTQSATRNDIPQEVSKKAEDVARDYLNKIAREWYQYMRSQGRYTLENVHLDIVLTHPANWSYEALNKIYRTVVDAFPRQMFPTLRDISFTSEPEAWSLYTVQDMLRNDHNTLIPGECFVLCDAGGGTVDLVTYRISRIEPLELQRIGKLSGKKCGASFIDQEFLKWLQPRLQNLDILPQDFNTGGHMVLMPKGRVLLERFEKVKHAFNGKGEGQITLPRGTIPNPEYEESIVNGVITLTEKDLKNFFAISVDGTLDLIERQVTAVTNMPSGGGLPNQVTNIFLGGGFAESEYLLSKIKEYADTMGSISVHRADDCWVGVAKGAVLRGIGIGMSKAPTIKSCLRHYGICVTHRYEEWRHDAAEVTQDTYRGVRVVRDQLLWLVKQGDAILPAQPIYKTIQIEADFTQQQLDQGSTISLVFAATNVPIPPSNLRDLPREYNERMNLEIESSRIDRHHFHRLNRVGRGSYFSVAIEVEICVSDGVTVRVKHGRNKLAHYETNL